MRSTAIFGLMAVLPPSLVAVTLLRGTPALAVAAEGGSGGADSTFAVSGASGGSSEYAGGTGNIGTSQAVPGAGQGNGSVGGGGGGGGGGAGSIGGDGGPGGFGTSSSDTGGVNGSGGTAAAVGGSTGGTGGAGSAPMTGDGGAGGGGGGAHGYYGATLPTNASRGGDGGNGGSVATTGGGGGGGAGASGMVLSGTGNGGGDFGTLGVNATGGFGGSGGSSGSGVGGSGGAAGYGVVFTDSSSVKSIAIGTGVTVQGGNAGVGGTGGAAAGSDGRGAAGISGSTLSITNYGTINAGTGFGSHAISFNGGSNTLFLTATSTINGDIAVTGTLAIDPNGSSRTLGTVLTDGNGGGSVEKIGVGTLILTGANNYSGGTTVSAGTLMLSGAGTLGAQFASLTIAGGTLDLGGTAQTQDGGVTLTSGVIQNGMLTSSGTFTVSSGTVSAILDGTGAVTKSGSGTVTFSGANTYSGGTTITAGTLRAQASAMALGSGPVTLDGGVLQLGVDTPTTFSNDVVVTTSSTVSADRVTAGAGVTHSLGALSIGAQTLTTSAGPNVTGGTAGVSFGAATLTGDATFSAGAGTLLSLASVTGIGQNLTFAGAGNSAVPGAIDIAAGSLTKAGSGTLALTGTSTYTGPTTVTGGMLNLNGSIANSIVTVQDGATLGGNGTLGGLIAQSGAIISPGNSIGQLNVAGNVGFAVGSVFRVELNAAGANDRIVATGTATLSGGTVQVLAQQGNYAASTRYRILTATGGVSGTFTGSTSNLAFLRPSLTYDPTNAYLTLDQIVVPSTPGNTTGAGSAAPGSAGSLPTAAAVAPIAFSSVAASANQTSAANAIQRLGAGNAVYDAVLSRSAGQARQAFDAVSGESHASQITTQFQTTMVVRENVLDRIRGFGAESERGAPTVPAAFAADLPGGRSAEVAPVPFTVLDPRVFAVWGRGFGSFGSTRANGNAGTLSRDMSGFVLGADATLDRSYRFGIAGGYTNSSLGVTSRTSTGAVSTGFGGLYGGASFGAINIRIGGTFASDSTDTHRSVVFPGFSDSLSARFGGTTLEGFGEIGYRIGFGSAMLEPFVGGAGIRIAQDRFTESGGAAALTVAGRSYDTQTLTVGTRGEIALADGSPFSLKGLVGYRRAFGTTTPVTLLAFAAGGQQFSTAGIPIDKDAVVAEAGVSWQVTRDVTVGVAYTGQVGARAQDHGAKGNILWRF